MRVALIVDNPRRDLPGLCLLAIELTRSGCDVFLVPMNLQVRELPAIAPDVVVVNYVRSSNAALLVKLKASGVGIILLDTEGGVFESAEWYEALCTGHESARRAVDFVCAWGEGFAKLSRDRGWYPANVVVVTGNPRFDLYDDHFAAVVRALAPAAARDHDGCVLFASSFSFANPRYRSRDEERFAQARELGVSLAEFDRRAGKTMDAMRRFTELAYEVAVALPEKTIVYRPHPFEDPAGYSGLIGGRKNLLLNGDGTIDGWLSHSSAVVTVGSTVAVEAAIAGVPAFSPGWIDSGVRYELPALCAQDVNSTGALLTSLRRPTMAVGDPAQVAIHDWFGPLDGGAHERVAKLVRKVGSVARPVNRLLSSLAYTGPVAGRRSRGLARVKRWTARPVGYSIRKGHSSLALEWDRTGKSFDVPAVEQIVGVLNRVPHPGQPLEVRVAEEDLIVPMSAVRSIRLRELGNEPTQEAN